MMILWLDFCNGFGEMRDVVRVADVVVCGSGAETNNGRGRVGSGVRGEVVIIAL